MTKIANAITWERIVQISLLLALVGFGFLLSYYAFHMLTNRIGLRGSEFAVFWTAAQMGQETVPWAAFDFTKLNARLSAMLGLDGSMFWYYPPTYLLAIWPLGWLPYPTALFLFTVLAIGIWVLLIQKTWPNSTWPDRLPMIAAPVLLVNVNSGQIGIWVAICLLGFVLALRQDRIWLAGLCAAALMIKPHFGVMMPLVLIFDRNWRVFGTATLCSAVFLGLATAVFGAQYWQVFLENRKLLDVILSGGQLTHLHITSFAFVSALGLPGSLASIAQLATAAFAAYALYNIWKTADWDLRMAGFLIASFLVSPYAFAYDLVATAAVIGLMFPRVAQTHSPGGKLLLGLLWVLPAGNLVFAGLSLYPVISLLLIANLVLCLHLSKSA